MLPPVVRAGSLPSTDRSHRRRSQLKIGAAAAVAAIAGVAVAASAGPAFAETTSRASGIAASAPASGRGAAAAVSPVLAAPVRGGSGPLATLSLDGAARGNSAPLTNPATGTAASGSPLAAQPAPAVPPRGQTARPSVPLAGRPGAPRPQQAAARPTASARPIATARPTASASPSASPSKAYEFYDSVEPETVPSGAIVGTYSTGARPVPASAVAGRKQVLWIDTLATDPAGSGALDVEPGCATPSQVPGWVSGRLKAHPDQVAIVYMSLSEWPQVQADVASLPSWMRSRIRWWVADPTGVPHIVPGSSATQWYWGATYDESMAAPNFDPDLVAGPSSP
ncbi:MAG TPA: hypothetical protein VMA73_07560 [Streptosporangiaceae bacterium]|nr:hypothetical protein [Streptosporangiaceae bacterium]